MLKTILFNVTGRVQGVGFRYATQRKAQALGLTGWVRNKANGDVEGMAQGREDNLSEFETWLWDGPQFASVSMVQCEIVRREIIPEFQVTH